MQEAKKNLGRVIRAARKKKGITQEDLVEQIGVQARMVLEIENGRGNPRFDGLYTAVRLLDIPSNDIFYYDRMLSTDTEKFLQELSSFSESEQRLALAAARAVLQQLRKESIN